MAHELRNLPAPAKLNLFLHVTGRRDDGYHLLETAFELIDLCDRIDLINRTDSRIELLDPMPGVEPEHNLVVRAARALAAHANRGLGVDIRLRKSIPVGGGLGGGSSDAATVLLGLNRLWNLRLPKRTLAQIGLKLGADVPVFVHGRTAWGRGIGERLRSIELPMQRYLVVQPPASVPTSVIFQAPELTRNSKPLKIMGFSLEPQNLASSLTEAIACGQNDLQAVAEKLYPAVALAITELRRLAGEFGICPQMVRMSGSGACIFVPIGALAAGATGASGELAEDFRRRIMSSPLFEGAWIVNSFPRHPLA